MHLGEASTLAFEEEKQLASSAVVQRSLAGVRACRHHACSIRIEGHARRNACSAISLPFPVILRSLFPLA